MPIRRSICLQIEASEHWKRGEFATRITKQCGSIKVGPFLFDNAQTDDRQFERYRYNSSNARSTKYTECNSVLRKKLDGALSGFFALILQAAGIANAELGGYSFSLC